MTTNKQQLREQAESVMHWSSSLTAAWPSDPDFTDAWTVGTIDEDGNRYPVIEVDADQYDAPGDSERLARFFTAANPATVLALLDDVEALQAECEKLRKDAARYQWLKHHAIKGSYDSDWEFPLVDAWEYRPGSEANVEHETLDDAIDAAMEGDQP